jgi:hypothetical protein
MELDKHNAISKHTKGITYLIERSFQELFFCYWKSIESLSREEKIAFLAVFSSFAI